MSGQRDLGAVLCHCRCARCGMAAWFMRFTLCSLHSASSTNTSHSSPLSHRKQDFLSCRCFGWENPFSAGLCTDCPHTASTQLCLHAHSLILFKLSSHGFLLSLGGTVLQKSSIYFQESCELLRWSLVKKPSAFIERSCNF